MKWINGYLMFDGKCREAMEFYQKSFGGDLSMSPYGEGQCKGLAAGEERIMHARLAQGGGLLMASDMQPGMPFVQGNNVSLAIECDDTAEQDRLFEAMSVGATVTMPLQSQFWGARFGMLTDVYGIHWMFNLDEQKAEAVSP